MPAKLQQFDQHVEQAVDELVRWLCEDRDALIALAKGRHVWGHFMYADSLMFEYDEKRLTVEAAEEIADAINYLARRRQVQYGDGYA